MPRQRPLSSILGEKKARNKRLVQDNVDLPFWETKNQK
jgi:hypothetical protein